jgi:uncharacterized protein YjbI with pentapeptide repeats
LCCVVPAFATSVDFAIDKPAGRPCPNLRPDFGCGIHDELRPRGFRGCTVYDCFGAGQQVAQVTFGGRDWRAKPQTRAEMFAVFAVMRQLHELLWYLTEALELPAAAPLRDRLTEALTGTERLTRGSPADLLALDLAACHRPAADLLRQASELTRAAYRPGPDLTRADLTRADLTGARLRGRDLRGASLRGASLIAADLRGADLRCADLLGADLRDADLTGADLTDAIFLIQAQLDAARRGPAPNAPAPNAPAPNAPAPNAPAPNAPARGGPAPNGPATRLPAALTRPAHWPQA